jgi:sec-independent protein translocase protein TatA
MRFGNFGVTELLIILVIVILLFGVGRLGKIGAELGKGIRNFRSAVKEGQQGEDSAPAAESSDDQA